MRGLFPGIGFRADPALRSPHRRAQCGTCKALRDGSGAMAPALHRHDLTVFALLGPEPVGPARSTWCSALPWMRVTADEQEPGFRGRLAALGSVMTALEALDQEADSQRAGLLARARQWVARSAIRRDALAPLGLTTSSLLAVSVAVASQESRAGSTTAEHLAPIQEFAADVFERLYAGVVPASDARRLGAAYVSVLCLLDAQADREEDRRRDHFNLWAAPSDAGMGVPAATLQSEAETLGSLLLRWGRPSALPVLRHLLETSLGPRVRAALDAQEVA